MWQTRQTYVFSLILIVISNVVASDLRIELKHGGSLIGTNLKSYKGRQIRSFLGIPYAKPPIGDLRFKPPEPFTWEGERNATDDGSQCFQTYFFDPTGQAKGSEDCLFLNIVTPPLYRIPKEGLPVMVNIHGGGWLGGSNSYGFFAPDYILDEDVILVSINYRVGIFGFLSTETLDCPGNFGLKDQVESLRWIKEYISSFGGNPNSVTIFGLSAGGGSVSYLLQSKTANGLFHRAIPQSGNLFNPWVQPLHKGVAQQRASKLASMFNCYETDWSKIVECLRKVDAAELTSKTNSLNIWNSHPFFVFQPVLEPTHLGAFIGVDPRKEDLNSQNIPILTGLTSGEGLMATASILMKEELLNDLKSDVSNKFPLTLGYDHWDLEKQKDITNKLEKFYLKDGHNYDKNNHQNFTDIYTDSLFLAGLDQYLRKRLSMKSAPTFVYIFDMAHNHSTTKMLGGGDIYLGVNHGDDLRFLFPFGSFFGGKSHLDGNSLAMKDALVELLVNFAAYGNPTPPGSRFTKWEPATKYPWNYARIGATDKEGFHILKNENNYANDRMEFWKHLNPHVEN